MKENSQGAGKDLSAPQKSLPVAVSSPKVVVPGSVLTEPHRIRKALRLLQLRGLLIQSPLTQDLMRNGTG